MRPSTFVLIAAAVCAAVLPAGAASSAIDAAFLRFWEAKSPALASKAADAIVQSGVSFDEALARFKKGRTYDANVPRGVLRRTHRLSDVDFAYQLEVPPTYDPARAYQVRIQLHGGVGREDASPRGNGIGALAGADQIYILPTAWAGVEWWTDRQLQNIQWILDDVKRTYNVDENRVVLSGVSDGGTGAYYLAMRDTTPFASFLPLNGALAVLQNVDADGGMFPNNFLNKPFFIINGGRDPLYPTSFVEPYIEQMVKGGVDVTYRPQPDAVHNTAWWPQMKDEYEAFVHDHPRHPFPDRVTLESDLTVGTNRAHWLVIDTLTKERADAPSLPDLNDFVLEATPNFRARVVPLFVRRSASGRVDLARDGNAVTATTRGVAAFTLLLSPEVFDFNKPVKVIADGRVVFDARVTPSLATLAKWAAHDNDRTLLVGAELKVRLTP